LLAVKCKPTCPCLVDPSLVVAEGHRRDRGAPYPGGSHPGDREVVAGPVTVVVRGMAKGAAVGSNPHGQYAHRRGRSPSYARRHLGNTRRGPGDRAEEERGVRVDLCHDGAGRRRCGDPVDSHSGSRWRFGGHAGHRGFRDSDCDGLGHLRHKPGLRTAQAPVNTDSSSSSSSS